MFFSKMTLKPFLKKTGRVTLSLVQMGCIYHCITQYGVAMVVCSGHSMEPTIYTGDLYLAEKISTYRKTLQRGDIVFVRHHEKPDEFICKRITGMSGDRIYNNKTEQTVKVQKGHVWLEGDNKQDSIDSRTYGDLPYALIQGRLVYRMLSAQRKPKTDSTVK